LLPFYQQSRHMFNRILNMWIGIVLRW
jgi:hypothetical protein